MSSSREVDPGVPVPRMPGLSCPVLCDWTHKKPGWTQKKPEVDYTIPRLSGFASPRYGLALNRGVKSIVIRSRIVVAVVAVATFYDFATLAL
ncbi:MAG: hypothetical protein ACK6EB_11485, partial [Planctomyces sp.]